jgi:heme/copper-type cytochrome/quinol oxidase subunit 2
MRPTPASRNARIAAADAVDRRWEWGILQTLGYIRVILWVVMFLIVWDFAYLCRNYHIVCYPM